MTEATIDPQDPQDPQDAEQPEAEDSEAEDAEAEQQPEEEQPEIIDARTLEMSPTLADEEPQLISGPPTVDAAWVESRVRAILAVEPFLGRPLSISVLELPLHLFGEEDDIEARELDRRLPFLVLRWPENNDGWSDEWTVAVPEGGDIGEYLEAVRDPLGL